MISIIGLGDCGCNIAEKFSTHSQYKIYYINAEAKDAAGNNALASSHSDIKFFPEEKVRLVVLYSGMKALQAAMGGMHEDAGINAAFTNFKNNVLSSIEQVELAETAIKRIDENLYNSFNFDTVRGRFKEAKLAIDKANATIDGSLPTTGYNAFSYHLREDPELVGTALSLSASELKNAQSIVAELSAMEDLAIKESGQYLALSGGHLQNAQQYLAHIQAMSAEDSKEYTWYNARYREVKAEYDQAFGMMQQEQAKQQPQGAN